MNALDILRKLFGSAADSLILLLDSIQGDGRQLAQDLIAKLRAAGVPDNMAAVAQDILRELGEMAQGKFDGRKHPSDLA